MVLVEYKKARLKYLILEGFEAGLELSGIEVKALRDKRGSLEGARVVVRGGEAFLVGATIPPFQANNAPKDYDAERTRRLLLTKAQIAELAAAEDRKGLTIVPLEVYSKGRLVKAHIAIVRGKGRGDKREALKEREAIRETERVLKRG